MVNKTHSTRINFLLKRINEVKVVKEGNKLIIEVPEDTTAVERDALANEALRLASAGESYRLESVEVSK